MTKEQEQKYEAADVLREIIKRLKGSRYRLDCGHHITFGYFLGNDITIIRPNENIAAILRTITSLFVNSTGINTYWMGKSFIAAQYSFSISAKLRS